ncbi:MAG: hypothetical protein HFE62_03215 [Firmicutes bacterium]|nr:hypothetical protein [Bacillota bacterium]
MEEQMTVLATQMETLAVLILIGFLAQKMKMVKNESIDGLMEIISKLILPFMLMTLIGSGSSDGIFEMGGYLAATVIMFAVSLALGFISSKIVRLPKNESGMHVLVSAYSNGGYIAMPVVAAMFPESSGLAIAVYSTIEAVMYWVFGPLIANSYESRKIDIKKLFTPITISVATGFVVLISNVNPVGNIAWDTLRSVGSTTKYLAAIYIGLDLGRKGKKGILSNPKAFSAVSVKLLIVPLAAYLILKLSGFVNEQQLVMLTVFAAAPSGMSLPIVAKIAGVDDSYAISAIMISTILCPVTMMLVMRIALSL